MRRIARNIIAILALIILDFISKIYFEAIYFGGICTEPNYTLDIFASCHIAHYIPIFGEYFGFQLAYNPGVAFGLPITGLPLQIITIALICGLIWHYSRIEYSKKSKLLDAGYILIIAGALSHAYERIFVGHVIDFIAIKYFAILNFADIFISIGAAILFIAYYVRKQ